MDTPAPIAVTPGDRVLVTGATGYIGGRLVPRLLDAGYEVVCVARDPGKVHGRPWAEHARVTILGCDVADVEALVQAMTGCRAAYYLVHSMIAAGHAYGERDRELAQGFAAAARRAGVARIVYLGGLGETGDHLSEHLSSRREIERVLAGTGVPVTVLRAAMIIGSGSASFEILRYLVDRLPVMITPRWVRTRCQPIAVRNVLHYLVAVLATPATTGLVLDIGGKDVRTYRELMQMMARNLGLRRRVIVTVPVLTPWLSSLWIHLVTPLSHRIARPLAEGLSNEVVCRDNRAAQLMPQPLLGADEAMQLALASDAQQMVETVWSDAGHVPGDPDWAGGRVFQDERAINVAASASAVYAAVCRIGGRHGWYAAEWLWRLRGLLDRLVGGPGLRRGRRHRERLRYGDALDFWRVAGVEPDRRLLLLAEMRLPGEAWLEFRIEPDGDHTRLTQTARFRSRGLFGLLYWYAVLPFHGIVFRGMLHGIRRFAENIPPPG